MFHCFPDIQIQSLLPIGPRLIGQAYNNNNNNNTQQTIGLSEIAMCPQNQKC